MAVIKKTLFPKNLDKYAVLVNDTDPNSRYFKITELPDTFTGGKNAFLVAGSKQLVPDTKIQIELRDSVGNIIYHEPGEGYISSSLNGTPFVTEYYEGVSKVVSVYVYPDTSYGPCTLTILGELSEYQNENSITLPVPLDWENKYNVKWTKTINVNPALANTTKIRFYQRPVATITEIVSPIYRIESGLKVDSGTNQSFADIKLSKLETFAGDVKRVKVFRTSEGDISDYDLIQDILVESKELLTSYGLSGSVVGQTGILTSETLKNNWNTGSLNTFLTSSRVESGVRLTGSGYFTYTSSLDIKSANTYELNLDAFYSASISTNLGIYLVSGSASSSIATLNGTTPTKNLLDTVIPFKVDKDFVSASLYFSQSQGEWHLGNISLKLSQDTAFSPDEISFITTMPTVIGNETYNFKFEFYDVNNNYVPVAVTQSLNFTGGTNTSNTTLLISASLSQSLAALAAVSTSISGTILINSSSVSTSVGLLTGSIVSLSGSVSSSLSSLSSSVSSSNVLILSSSLHKVQQLANGNFSGSFISGSIVGEKFIFSPVVGGVIGYFSELFKVGKSGSAEGPSIYLDARQNPRKIFIGGSIPPSQTEASGAYNNSNTNVYLDSSGKFSLADKLTFDGAGNLSVNGTINVTGGNAATDANALLYATRAATSASVSASAAQSAAILQAISDASSSINLLANGNWTAGSGTFITSNSISSPIIAANGGYISGILRVGQNGITLDGGNKKIYVGGDGTTGYYNNANTPFYFASGSTNIFSLGTGLTWSGNTLSISGSGNFSGTLVAAGGTFKGDITAAGGLIGGWYIDSSSIYVPNAISLNSSAKSITISDTGSVPRVLINQNTSFSSLAVDTPITVSAASLNNTAGGYTAGTYDRTLGTALTVNGGTYNVTGTWSETNGVSAVVLNGTAYTIDVWSQIVVYNGVTETIIGEYKDGITLGSTATWYAINGVVKSSTMTGNGNTWTIKQRFKLQYNGSGLTANSYRQPGLSVIVARANSFVEIIAGGIQVGRDASNYVIMARTGASAMLQVGGEGTFTGDVTANTSSDIRLKEDIVKIPNAIDKVLKISGNTFKWKNGFEEVHSKTGMDIGVIAQEIESILPDIVVTRHNGYKGVQYEKLVALLIEAIKELKNEIDELKNR